MQAADHQCWKDACIERFSTIKEVFNSVENQALIKPTTLAHKIDEYELKRIEKDPYLKEKEETYHGKFYEVM